MSSDTNDSLDNNVPGTPPAEDDRVDSYESSESDFGPGAPKCPRLEEEDEEESEISEEETGRNEMEKESSLKLDPGKKAYEDMDRILHSLQQLGNKEEKSSDDTQRVLTFLHRLKKLVDGPEDEGEVSNPNKLLQIFYKHKKLMSGEKPNIANFLEGLEDASATKSEEDSEDSATVFVFLAPMATELWYRWDNTTRQWQWTPDKRHWMFCSRTTVSGGRWDNETPAPENVEIIHYLNAIRPMPSDEQYLPQYNVVKILSLLREFQDEEVNKLVQEIGQSVTDAQEKWPFQDPQLRFPNFREE